MSAHRRWHAVSRRGALETRALQRALVAAVLLGAVTSACAATPAPTNAGHTPAPPRAADRCLAVRAEAERASAALTPGAMVALPGGRFIMGSPAGTGADDERPAHSVDVAPFSLDRTEVTVRDYRECVARGACTEPIAYASVPGKRRIWCNWKHPEGRATHPINCVTWHQATAYCASLGKRLPTEEEWEHAARPRGTEHPWGDAALSETRLNACGPECVDSAEGKGFERFLPVPWEDCFPESAPVGSFPAGATPEGVLDLAGNVAEWTSSHASESYDAPRSDTRIIQRGGSWYTSQEDELRAEYRLSDPPEDPFYFIGFRCAR